MIGSIKGEFSVELPPIIKQSGFGILTENGLVKSENTLLVQLEDKGVKRYSSHENGGSNLQQMLKNLRTSYEELEAAQAKALPTLAAIVTRTKTELKELKQSLQLDAHSKYTSSASLQAAQSHFLEFADFLVTRAMDNEEDIKKQVFETLRVLMCRTELDLEHVGFQDFQQSSGIAASVSSKLAASSSGVAHEREAEAIKIGMKYFTFLNSCLRLVLVNIRSKALEQYERSFVQFCLNFCFFRLIPFQKMLTGVLDSTYSVAASAPNIGREEWKKYYLGAKDYSDRIQKAKKGARVSLISNESQDLGLATHMDWQGRFFSFLEKSPEYSTHLGVFNEMIGDTDWSKILGKKGTGFFYFITESTSYLQESLPSHLISKIDMLEIPGYDTLMCAFMHELRNKEVIHYSDAQLQALLSTLEGNPKLVNTYFTIVAQRTK